MVIRKKYIQILPINFNILLFPHFKRLDYYK